MSLDLQCSCVLAAAVRSEPQDPGASLCVSMCAVGCSQGGFPEVRVMLCIGGIDMRTQMDTLRKGE